VVGDMRQAVGAEILRAHALWALSGSGCPSLFNFFILLRRAGDGRDPLDLPGTRIAARRARVVIYTKEFITRA